MKFKNLALVGFFLLIFLIISEGAHHKLTRFERKRQSSTLSIKKDIADAKLDTETSIEEPSAMSSVAGTLSETSAAQSENELQKSETAASLKTEASKNSTLSVDTPSANLLKKVEGKTNSLNETLATNSSAVEPIQSSLNKEEKGANSVKASLNTDSSKTEGIAIRTGLKNSKQDSEVLGNSSNSGANETNSSSAAEGSALKGSQASEGANASANASGDDHGSNANNASSESESNHSTSSSAGDSASNDSSAGAASNNSASNESSAALSENLNNHKFTAIKAPHNSTILRDNNSSLELLIDKDGNKYEKVQYVQTLSPYAREELSILRDPARASSNLIGKPFYFENNMTFDETPKIFGDVINAKVWDTSRTKRDMTQYLLWKDFDGKGMNEVAFKKDNGEEEFEGTLLAKNPETAKFEDVEIKLNRTAPKTDSDADPVLDQVDNPVKKQLFDVNQKQEVTYDKAVLQGLESTVVATGAVVGVQESKAQLPSNNSKNEKVASPEVGASKDKNKL